METLAVKLLSVLFDKAASAALMQLAEGFAGDARSREFSSCVRQAIGDVSRVHPQLTQLNVDTDFFRQPSVVEAFFAVLLPGSVDLRRLGREFRQSYDEAELGITFEEIAENFQEALSRRLLDRPEFVGLLTHRNTEKIAQQLSALEERLLPAADDGRTKILREWQKQINDGPLGTKLEATLESGKGSARLRVSPLPGRTVVVEGTLNLVFPQTPQGETVMRALDDVIARGGSIEIPGEFIEPLQPMTADGLPLPFPAGRVSSVRIGQDPSDSRPTRLTLYRKGRELAGIDVALRVRRSGSEETLMVTEPIAPLRVVFLIERREGNRAEGNINLRVVPGNFQHALEGWRIVRFMSCLPETDVASIEFLDSGIRQVSQVRAGANLRTKRRALVLLRAAATIQEQTGAVMPVPGPTSRLQVRLAISAARAITHGTLPFTFRRGEIETTEKASLDDVEKRASAGFVSLGFVSARTVAMFGRSIDLGPVLQYMPNVRINRVGDELFEFLPGASNQGIETYYRWTQFQMPTDDLVHKFHIGEPGEAPVTFLRPS